MSFNNIKFTTKGRNLHAKVQAGAALNFTKIVIGDGDNGGADSSAYDNLLNPLHNISITKLKSTSNGTAIVGGVFNNSGLAAFYLREIGLFATDPDLGEILYCYGNAGASAEYIPEGGGSTILERQLNIVATIGNATTLTALIDYSMYSTMEFVQDEVAAHDIDVAAHSDIRTLINNLANLIDVYHSEKYFYKLGNECTDLTGGWVQDATSGGSGLTSKETTYMYAKVENNSSVQAAYGMKTVNAVDVTTLSTLKIRAFVKRVTVHSFTGQMYIALDVPSIVSEIASAVAWAESDITVNAYAEVIVTLDVSALSGLHNISVFVRDPSTYENVNCEAKFMEIWGE